MTIAGILVTDADSLDAAADRLDSLYADTLDNIIPFPTFDRDPQPPSPAALAVRPVCPACDGIGKVAFLRPNDPCWYCDGSGFDVLAGEQSPAPVPFDRAAHCRRIASYGGNATLAAYGRHHFAIIGATGARVTIERHGLPTWRGIVTGKGWRAPRQLSLVADLAAGRSLAQLAA